MVKLHLLFYSQELAAQTLRVYKQLKEEEMSNTFAKMEDSIHLYKDMSLFEFIFLKNKHKN